jgi:hypothetical protein
MPRRSAPFLRKVVMVGKLTTVLTKKEAETYRSQGLHEEAIRLYEGLLTSHTIDPALRSAIQSQIVGINEEINSIDTQKMRPLTADEVMRIRDGWGDKATETDTLVCAQSFYRVGAYNEALQEYFKILNGTRKKKYLDGVADCLVRLYAPEAAVSAAERLARALSPSSRVILAIMVALAKHMAFAHHADHALAFYQHLSSEPALADSMKQRIAGLNPDSKGAIPSDGGSPDMRKPDSPPREGRCMAILRRLLRKF